MLKLPVHFRPRGHYQLKLAKQSALNIKYLAQSNHITVTEMTRILFRAGLKAEANIDFNKYKSVKELLQAMKKDKRPPQDKIKQTISIRVAREERTVIRIDQTLHAAIKEFGDQRGLKAH